MLALEECAIKTLNTLYPEKDNDSLSQFKYICRLLAHAIQQDNCDIDCAIHILSQCDFTKLDHTVKLVHDRFAYLLRVKNVTAYDMSTYYISSSTKKCNNRYCNVLSTLHEHHLPPYVSLQDVFTGSDNFCMSNVLLFAAAIPAALLCCTHIRKKLTNYKDFAPGYTVDTLLGICGPSSVGKTRCCDVFGCTFPDKYNGHNVYCTRLNNGSIICFDIPALHAHSEEILRYTYNNILHVIASMMTCGIYIADIARHHKHLNMGWKLLRKGIPHFMIFINNCDTINTNSKGHQCSYNDHLQQVRQIWKDRLPLSHNLYFTCMKRWDKIDRQYFSNYDTVDTNYALCPITNNTPIRTDNDHTITIYGCRGVVALLHNFLTKKGINRYALLKMVYKRQFTCVYEHGRRKYKHKKIETIKTKYRME